MSAVVDVPVVADSGLSRRVSAAPRGISGAEGELAYWRRVTLRDRKKLETFRALQSAARQLVGERGLAGVTVEEIAAMANVSSRTFFNYFDSKEAAVVDAEPDDPARLAAALAARPADEPPLESLRAAVVGEFARMAPRFRELCVLMRANPALIKRESAAFKAFYDVIVAWATKRLGTDVHTHSYCVLLAGITQLLTRLVATHTCPSGKHSGVDMADELFAALARGLTVPPDGARAGSVEAILAGGTGQVIH